MFCASCSILAKVFKTRIEEHIKKDNKPHNFVHLQSIVTCFDSYNSPSFKIIDKSNSKFDLKIKELLHINWRKLTAKSFSSHSFTIACVTPLFFSLVFFVFFFAFHFHLLFSLSLRYLLESFLVLITLRYYFIRL